MISLRSFGSPIITIATVFHQQDELSAPFRSVASIFSPAVVVVRSRGGGVLKRSSGGLQQVCIAPEARMAPLGDVACCANVGHACSHLECVCK